MWKDKAYSGYDEDGFDKRYRNSKGPPGDVHFTEGDWAVKTYERNGATNLTHKHKNGTTYVIPFRYCVTRNIVNDTTMCDYGCHVCHDKAPDNVVVVWKLLNYDNWEV